MEQYTDPTVMLNGSYFLELIGYGHYIGQETGYMHDGRPVLAEQFPLLCEAAARPILMKLEALDPEDPQYGDYIDVARMAITGFFGRPEMER